MDFDLDLFDRKDRNRDRHRDDDDDDDDRGRGSRRARNDRDDDDDRGGGRSRPARSDRDDDDDRGPRRAADDDERDGGWRQAMQRGRRHAPRGFRAGHRHLFAWLVVGGGVVLLGLLAIGVLSALGLWGPIADGYFAASMAVLPASWHDEWTAMPGVVHVGMGLAALFVAAGVAGEVLD